VIDEPTDAELKTAVSPGAAESDEERFWEAVDEIVASEREFQKHAAHLNLNRFITQEMMLAFVLGNFSTAFIQALGTRAADGVAKLPKRVSDLVRTRVHRKGKPDEYQFGVDDGSAATIAITADTPDEARLALLDLDVTADELRGKTLWWDSTALAWRPADDQ
jgi:hypothetical protein